MNTCLVAIDGWIDGGDWRDEASIQYTVLMNTCLVAIDGWIDGGDWRDE